MSIAQKIVEELNKLHALDPSAALNLIGVRVGCSDAIGEHSHFLAREHEHDGATTYSIGFLGVLNSIVPFDADEKVAASFLNSDGSFAGFTVVYSKRSES